MTKTKAEQALEILSRFGAGAVDEMLFGLPEYALKNLGKRKDVEDWISVSPKAYKAGETAGTLGSILLPFGLIGKGAKAATGLTAASKLLPAATAAKKGVDWSKILGLAGRGAAAGGAEAGVRNITSESEAPISSDILAGSAFGAGGGVLGGLLSAKLPQAVEKLKEITSKSYLKGRGMDTRSLRQGFMGSMPSGAGPAYKTQKAGEYVSDVADFMKEVPRGKNQVEAMAKLHSDTYETLNDAWKKTFGKASAEDMIKGVISPDDMAKVAEEFGPEVAEKAKDYIIKGASGKKGLRETKEFFQGKIDSARLGKIPDDEVARAVKKLGYGLINRTDDIAANLAEKIEGIDYGKLKRDYRLAKPIEIANMKSELTLPTMGGGSPTAEKLFARDILEGGKSLGGTMEDALKGGASGLLGVLGMKAASRLGSRSVGALDTIAKKYGPEIAEKVASAPGLAAIAGGRAAADIVTSEVVKKVKPKGLEEKAAANIGAEAGKAVATGEKEVYLKKINDRMMEFWATSGAEQMFPGQFDLFRAVIAQKTDNFNPEKTAAILFPDPGKREKFQKAYQISKRLNASFETAEKAPRGLDVLPGLFDPEEEKAARLASNADIMGILAEAISKTGAPDAAKTAKSIYSEIMSSPGTVAQKRKLLQNTLGQFGVDFGTIEEAGLA